MYLKVDNDINNNIFSVKITVDALGSENMSEEQEKELIENFPSKLAYRNLVFTKNIKIDGSIPIITDEAADGETIVTLSLPPLSNKEILVDENFEALYKIDYTKISPSVIDTKVLTTAELVSQAYCNIFADVIIKAVREIMDKMREKAPLFEGELIIPV